MAFTCLAFSLGAPLAAERQARQTAGSAVETAPTGVIVGTVVDETSGRPLSGAIVTLGDAGGAGSPPVGAAQSGPPPKPVLTGGDGRFLFARLRASQYRITVNRNGYLGSPGPALPTPILIDLAAGERRTDVKIPLARPAAITGAVVDDHGDPVVGVSVSALRHGWSRGRSSWLPAQNSDRTDDRGVFRIGALAPGEYAVVVEQSMANAPVEAIDAAAKEAERRTNSKPVQEQLFQVDAPISGPGVSYGRAVGSQVQGLPVSTTLPSTSGGRTMVFVPTYFPAARSLAKATLITLASGEVRTGVDFAIRPVQAFSVTGRAMGPDGPLGFTAVGLINGDSSDRVRSLSGNGEIGTVTDGAGAFTFLTVPAGSYVLRINKVPRVAASNMVMQTIVNPDGSVSSMGSSSGPPTLPPLPPEPTLWADLPVSVSGRDVTDLVVTVRAGAHMSGRVEFDGSAPRPTPQQLAQIQVNVSSLDPSIRFSATPRVRVSDTGDITSQGIAAGPYLITVSPGAGLQGWSLQSIMSKGVDVSQHGIEIGASDITDLVVTFTDQPSDLSGTVTGRDGSPAAGASVVVFPADEPFGGGATFNARRHATSRASSTGRFTLRNLPPGAYHVIAIDDPQRAAAFDDEFLRGLVGKSTSVTIGAGEKKQQALQLVSVK